MTRLPFLYRVLFWILPAVLLVLATQAIVFFLPETAHPFLRGWVEYGGWVLAILILVLREDNPR